VVRVPGAPEIHRRLLERGILAGLVLAEAEPDDPSLADGLLVCATEVTTHDEIGRFAATLSDIMTGRPPIAVEAGAGTSRAGAVAQVGR
jgi:glycine dehydrogenase subunit 1